jgi:hypothetical protein
MNNQVLALLHEEQALTPETRSLERAAQVVVNLARVVRDEVIGPNLQPCHFVHIHKIIQRLKRPKLDHEVSK